MCPQAPQGHGETRGSSARAGYQRLSRKRSTRVQGTHTLTCPALKPQQLPPPFSGLPMVTASPLGKTRLWAPSAHLGCAHPQGQGASSACPCHLPPCGTGDAAASRAPADGHSRLRGEQAAPGDWKLPQCPPALTLCHAAWSKDTLGRAEGTPATGPGLSPKGRSLATVGPQAWRWARTVPPAEAAPRGSQCAFQQPECEQRLH